jgi:glycosyltransferase involved in cell wall biosynthesis
MRISVVVPAYNAAKTVAETLDALLAQSLPATDIVVVDDGSKDDTRAALEPYRGRARLIFQPNGGVSSARNRGVAEAGGDWVAFCDADDLWHPDKLKIVSAAAASRPDADLVFHDFWTIESGRVVEPRATHSNDTMFPIFREFDLRMPQILADGRRIETGTADYAEVETWYGNAFRWLMVGNFLMPSTVAIRKAAFAAATGFDPAFRYAEDTEFFLRFAKKTQFLWIDAALTGYRREAGTLLTGNMLPTILGATRAVVKHCIDDGDVLNSDPKWVGTAVSGRFTRLAYYCLSELKLTEARLHARTALEHNPKNAKALAIVAASYLPKPVLQAARRLKSSAGRS